MSSVCVVNLFGELERDCDNKDYGDVPPVEQPISIPTRMNWEQSADKEINNDV